MPRQLLRCKGMPCHYGGSYVIVRGESVNYFMFSSYLFLKRALKLLPFPWDYVFLSLYNGHWKEPWQTNMERRLWRRPPCELTEKRQVASKHEMTRKYYCPRKVPNFSSHIHCHNHTSQASEKKHGKLILEGFITEHFVKWLKNDQWSTAAWRDEAANGFGLYMNFYSYF